jgi:5-(carboxyamino)imidazole ribonucleotide synthase
MSILKRKIGIIGGGQLGRMMIEESLRLNVEFTVLENTNDCPCYGLANQFIEGSLYDETKIKTLSEATDVMTFEIEHINTEALLALEKEGKTIIPSPKVLQIIQDKGLQKQFYIDNNIPTSPFILVNDANEWSEAIAQLGTAKFVAKTRKDGYDGKGVAILNSAAFLNGEEAVPFQTPCILEAFIPCEKEIAIIVAKDTYNNIVAYDPIEMEFDPIANLVTFLFAPAQLTEAVANKAKKMAMELVSCLNSPGLFAVEMFVSANNEILVNEIAPRPHNSGHHTIEACYTSQYEQLVRILLGLPVGSPGILKPAAMINLLGPSHFSGKYALDNWSEISAIEGVYIHLYGKKESKPIRKMGHITLLANTVEDLKAKADKVMSLIGFSPAD